MFDATIQSAPCSICSHIFPAEEIPECKCGDRICEFCPAYGCSCVDDDPTIHTLRVQLRAGAIELAQLQAERELMGAESFTTEQQARLLLLTDVVASLRLEIDEINWIEDQEEFSVNGES